MQTTQVGRGRPRDADGAERAPDRWLGFCWFLFALAVLLPVLTAGPEPGQFDPIATHLGSDAADGLARSIANLYYDDGFYYLGIARNWAHGRGSTFDGRNLTNGYHPLWLLSLLPLAITFSTPEGLLLSSFGLQALAAAATTLLVYRASRLFSGPLPSSVAALAWIRLQHSYYTAWSGLEYGVHALVIACLLYLSLCSARQRSLSSRQLLLLGLVAALAFLARIENLLLALLLGVALWRRAQPRARLWFYAAPVALTVVAYLLINQLQFDHPLPVSGATKAAWSASLLARDPVYLEHGWLAAKIVDALRSLAHFSRSGALGLALGSIGATIIAASDRSRRIRALWPAALFGVLQIVLYRAIYHGGDSMKPWYFVVQFLLASLIAAWLLQWMATLRLGHLASPTAVLLAILLVFSTGVNALRHRAQIRHTLDPFLVAAGWVQRNVPVDTRVAAWNAGTIGFLSDRQVTNLDGLVNSWSFLRGGGDDLCEYLTRENISYVVDVVDLERPFELHESELGSCVELLQPVWEGARYERPGPPWGAAAFRWLGRR